jgi:allantoin racemase
MRKLLLINPNTTDSITALLHTHATRTAGGDVQIRSVTARFGAPYIACEASYAVASHATLDAWAAAVADGYAPDVVLIACFGDPGLLALRESSAVPVTGLAEAAFVEAARKGRFAVVTGGAKWKPMLERHAQALGFGEALAGIRTVAETGAWLAANSREARMLLANACRQAASEFGVQSVILGGAGLAGMAEELQVDVGVPVIDSVQGGVRHALALVERKEGKEGKSAGGTPGRFDVAWNRMPTEMSDLGLPAV